MTDRFTEASTEITVKNPYVCDGCAVTYGHPTVGHLTIGSGSAHRDEGLDQARREIDEIIFGNPMHFGDGRIRES